MKPVELKQKLTALFEARFAPEGYFVVEIKTPPPNKIQLFVDGDNGITVDKCAEISRYVESFLDSEGWVGERYVLEVSSPGMDKPLKLLRQYKKNLGRKVEVVLTDGAMKRGMLKAADEEKIILESEAGKKKRPGRHRTAGTANDLLEIPFGNIKRTKLSFSFKQ